MRKILITLAMLLLAVPAFAQHGGSGPTAGGYDGGAVDNPFLAPDGATGAPGYSFTSSPSTGMYWDGTSLKWSIAGSTRFTYGWAEVGIFTTNGLRLDTPSGSLATYLTVDAANTLALRNSTAAQTFNVYNTWTDASNYERASFTWTGNVFYLDVTGAGTGSDRAFVLDAAGRQFVFNSAQLHPTTTDAVSFGASTVLWKHVYVGQSVQGSKSKALTDAAAATPFMTVAVPTNGWVGGELGWTATSVSGADQLTTVGRIRFAGATTTTTPVCTVGVIGTDLPAVSAGGNTLVCTWTNVVAAQTCALSVTCTNDLAAAQAITLYGRADMQIPATLVFP